MILGGGFERPSQRDLAYVIWQIYNWMNTTVITFPFNGIEYSFNLWHLFITVIVFWIVVDILTYGFQLLTASNIVYDERDW